MNLWNIFVSFIVDTTHFYSSILIFSEKYIENWIFHIKSIVQLSSWENLALLFVNNYLNAEY